MQRIFVKLIKMHQQQCAFILLFIFIQIVPIIMQGTPISPCPKMFQYHFEGTEWFGKLSVKNPLNADPLHLHITLSLQGKPATDYLGEIELLTRGQYLSDTPVLYKIKFPKSYFIPKLLQITVNGQVVCLGTAEQGIFITQIQLEHTRKYTFPNGNISSPLTAGFKLPTAATPDQHIPEDFNGIFYTDDQATNFASESQQLPNLPLTRYDSPVRATKDICGTVDMRIQFQVFYEARRTRSTSDGRVRKSAVNKYRSSAGDIPSQKAPNGNEVDSDYHNVDDLNDDINKSGARTPLVISDFPEPFDDDADLITTDSLSKGLTTITRGAWPWLAAVYVNNLTTLVYQCGGTLISASVVVSSAHCFQMVEKRYNENEILVFLGRHNLRNWNEEGSMAAPVDNIFIHPEFDEYLKTYDADIAVLVLRNFVRFNAFIRPACLWSGATDTEFIEGEHGVVVGWGLRSTRATIAAAYPAPMTYSRIVPRPIYAPIVSNDVCFKADEKYYSLTSNRTFCAGIVDDSISIPEESKLKKFKAKMSKSTRKKRKIHFGPCSGDSGAGLMIYKNNRWVLRGTVSAYVPMTEDDNNRVRIVSEDQKRRDSVKVGCTVNQYVIYTDVAKFLDWVYAFLV